MSSKVSLPQGTRDFGPEVVRKRTYILNTIRSVFELYGFQPLETPAMENMETLMGKYGEEGDKLIFKILNSGDPFSPDFLYYANEYLNNLENFAFNQEPGKDKKEYTVEDYKKAKELNKSNPEGFLYIPKLKNDISEKALRYDLTIPFARYVAMNRNMLTFPFKRYQVQPVWRADRPQRGRYREFYQCDADVVGSKGLINEVELGTIYSKVFEKLGIDVEIKLNSRKILVALAELCGGKDKMTDITVAIDKLDKIGIEKVKEELLQRGLLEEQVKIIEQYLSISGTNQEMLSQVKSLIGHLETGKEGIEEIGFVLNYNPDNQSLRTDFTLARGLNYYTGVIFEVKALNAQMGSIGGGGRYDDLTGLFGVPGIPGVGISFGVDRIYDVMDELKLFPEDVHSGTKVLFFNLGDAESKAAFGLMQTLREQGISCELFHENSKFDKQFKYADKKHIPYAVMIGSKELEEGNCNVKDLRTGKQEMVSMNELRNYSF